MFEEHVTQNFSVNLKANTPKFSYDVLLGLSTLYGPR